MVSRCVIPNKNALIYCFEYLTLFPGRETGVKTTKCLKFFFCISNHRDFLPYLGAGNFSAIVLLTLSAFK